MKVALLTYFAASVACTTAANADAVKVMPDLFGAEQLVDVEAHCEGCQPDYCYADKGERADYECYKSGYPKCCTKDKGNCPNNNKPGCECDGPCSNNTPDRDQKCWLRGISGDNTCPSGQYCEVAEGDCLLRITDVEGRCKPEPEMCTADYNPVCGCDEKTYSNSCGAAAAGVNVARTGKCSSDTRGDKCILGRNDCGGSEFCKTLNAGDCMLRIAEIEGRCETIPEVCGRNYDPVCGCDGETYSNACVADAAGVNVATNDACHEPYSCVGAQGQEFPLCQANDNNQNAYCDGENDCGSTFCDCPAGKDFCDSRVNPCEDEESYTCVGDQGQEFPLCAANGNDAGEYCDGGGDCNSSRCACDAGEDFCDTRNNPCD